MMEEATRNNEESVVDCSSCTDISMTVEECCSNDFKKWQQGTDKRHIINNVIVDYKGKVTVAMISDAIAWNICNLTKSINWKLPEQIITPSAKVKSVQWIKFFKKYVLDYMKKQWMAQFVRIFHLPKFNCLRSDNSTNMLSFKRICDMTKNSQSFEVSIFH